MKVKMTEKEFLKRFKRHVKLMKGVIDRSTMGSNIRLGRCPFLFNLFWGINTDREAVFLDTNTKVSPAYEKNANYWGKHRHSKRLAGKMIKIVWEKL